MLLALALVVITEKKIKIPEPFSVRIISPGESKEQRRPMPPAPPAPRQRYQEQKASRMPRLPRDLPPPEDFSAVPAPRTSAPAQGKNAARPREEILAGKPSGALSQNHPGSPQKEEMSSSVIGQQGMLKYGNEGGDNFKKSPSSSTGPKTQSPGTLKEKLFDKNVIGQLARKREREETKSNNTLTFDTSDYKYFGYMQRLKEKIEGIWKYPPEASGRGLYGDLYIKFTIKKDGKLGAVELVRTSGHKGLDDAAIRALKDADPFWPLPTSWEDDGLTITGHFVYSLYGTYIR